MERRIIVEEEGRTTIYSAEYYDWIMTDKGVAIVRKKDGLLVQEVPIIGIGMGQGDVIFKTYIKSAEV